MVASGAATIDASPFRPGVILGGRYRLIARIGAGSMGEVWRGEHLSLGTISAIKVLDGSRGQNAEDRLLRFHQEARASAKLRSPNIVQVLDHGVDGRYAFIAMELLDGEGLDQRLRRKGRLTPAETSGVIAGMARGLSCAHAAGILHRDIKPANVFLVREPGGEIVKLLDFGIAKLIGDPAEVQVQTHEGRVLGTPSYMSPEQVRGFELDPRSDLWAMGIIAYECLTGRRPFDGPTLGDTFLRICSAPLVMPSTIAPLPPGIDAWIRRALDREVDARFSSATEMALAFAAASAPDDDDDPRFGVSGEGPAGAAMTAPVPAARMSPQLMAGGAQLPAPPPTGTSMAVRGVLPIVPVPASAPTPAPSYAPPGSIAARTSPGSIAPELGSAQVSVSAEIAALNRDSSRRRWIAFAAGALVCAVIGFMIVGSQLAPSGAAPAPSGAPSLQPSPGVSTGQAPPSTAPLGPSQAPSSTPSAQPSPALSGTGSAAPAVTSTLTGAPSAAPSPAGPRDKPRVPGPIPPKTAKPNDPIGI